MFPSATKYGGAAGARADKEPPERWGQDQKREQQFGNDSWRTARRYNSQEDEQLHGKERESREQCGQESWLEEGRKKTKTEGQEAEH